MLLLLPAVQYYSFAGDYSLGGFNSPRGFGLSVDYALGDDIRNSYSVFAETYGIFGGKYNVPGLKGMFLHYNRLASLDMEFSALDLFFAPGGSIGWVRDNASGDRFGLCTSVDFAIASLLRFDRGISIEFGFVVEAGLFSRPSGNGVRISMYHNGVMQAYYPHIKLMFNL